MGTTSATATTLRHNPIHRWRAADAARERVRRGHRHIGGVGITRRGESIVRVRHLHFVRLHKNEALVKGTKKAAEVESGRRAAVSPIRARWCVARHIESYLCAGTHQWLRIDTELLRTAPLPVCRRRLDLELLRRVSHSTHKTIDIFKCQRTWATCQAMDRELKRIGGNKRFMTYASAVSAISMGQGPGKGGMLRILKILSTLRRSFYKAKRRRSDNVPRIGAARGRSMTLKLRRRNGRDGVSSEIGAGCSG